MPQREEGERPDGERVVGTQSGAKQVIRKIDRGLAHRSDVLLVPLSSRLHLLCLYHTNHTRLDRGR
jgi:hypothetical protein